MSKIIVIIKLLIYSSIYKNYAPKNSRQQKEEHAVNLQYKDTIL